MAQLRVFVGSSTEGLSLAKVLVGILKDAFDARLWKGGGVFQPGTYTLETLDKESGHSDFVIILGTADDSLTKRGRTATAVRDNLVFEFAFFLGAIGRRRTFLVVPEAVELALPTELDGLSLVKYDATAAALCERDMLRVLQCVASDLRNAIEEESLRMVAARAKRKRKLLATGRIAAIRRLHNAVTQLRDLLIELPSDALSALGDREEFEGVKRAAVDKVDDLYRSWKVDAEIVDVRSHFENLALATKRAVVEFPYPEQFFVTAADLRDGLVSLVMTGVVAARDKKSAAGAVRGEMESKFEARLRAVQEQYVSWWGKHARQIRRCTTRLHDALTTAAVSLATEETSGATT